MQLFAKVKFFSAIGLITFFISGIDHADRVRTSSGIIEGTRLQNSGVRIFKGIPFAAPPVGDLRWKPPQPARSWEGVRETVKFGPRCVQHPVFSEMVFRSDGMSEDCLYLNIWTPAKTNKDKLPVLVYFYGGGFITGDGSEPRYDGESMATKGIVVVTLNYRLGVFGFLAHPELTKESPQKASGNYGLLDQAAGLRWVNQNIAAFGGDPEKVTIAGVSAGSFSVSAHMVSPLSKDLIWGAIGESGSAFSFRSSPRIVSLEQAERNGKEFTDSINADSLVKLRALTTEELQMVNEPRVWQFLLAVDGYFFSELPAKTFAEGRQSQVPLLIGWNSEESNWHNILGGSEPSPENYSIAVRQRFGDHSAEILKLYPGATVQQVIESATDLAGDQFISFGTWKWSDTHSQTGGKPVFRYYYAHPRPLPKDAPPYTLLPIGAWHSAEVEYAMGNLPTNMVYEWTADDYKVSNVMQNFFVNFIKTGDPNGKDLPVWEDLENTEPIRFMRLDANSRMEEEKHRDRYLFWENF